VNAAPGYAPASVSTGPETAEARPTLLFVGAFPPPESEVVGGNVTACRILMASSFPRRVRVVPLDSTQRSVPPPPFARRLRHGLGRVASFGRLLRRERPDAVLLFASTGASFLEKSLCAARARAAGVPALLFVRDGNFMRDVARSPAFRRAAGALLRIPRLLLCQGASWQAFYAERFGYGPEHCPVVESWAATPELTAIGARRRVRRSGPVEVLFLGWADRPKGLFELLEAVRGLASDPALPEVRLTVAGAGADLDHARAFAEREGIAGRVRFAGWVDGAERLALLERADVFALPSYAEGLPNAMVEAMAAGLPVVVTPVGSIPDVVEDGAQGLLVPPRDPAALEAALRRTCDADERERMGRAAYETAVARFSAEHAAERLAEIVAGVVAAHRR
jgi:glycosyltransferase involved in cell wall biosynthesis